MKLVFKSILLVTLLAAATLGSVYFYFDRKPHRGLAAENKNVVFILIDTLRADKLPFYGYSKDTSPFLRKLSENAAVFNSAVSPSSWTAPSVASIFTSQFPSEHGVITGFVVRERLKDKNQKFTFNKVGTEQFTMPEYFKSIGYQTIGVADNLNISPALGFDQGFDSLDTFRDKGAEEIRKKVSARLQARDKGRPFFLYIHFMDPHYPFRSRAPWYEHSPEKRQDIRNRYDSEISFTDDNIRLLFEEFPILKESLVVLTADHGEQFWEHGQRGHGKTLHRPEIHVPLFFYNAAMGQQVRINEPASSIDILPTLAELTGGEGAPDWRGRSLSGIIDGSRATKGAFSELLFDEAEIANRNGEFRSLVIGSRHLIKKLGLEPVLSTYEWMKDLDETSGQEVKDGSAEAQLFDSYENSLSSSHHEQGEVEFDQDAVEQLKTLGYVQ